MKEIKQGESAIGFGSAEMLNPKEWAFRGTADILGQYANAMHGLYDVRRRYVPSLLAFRGFGSTIQFEAGKAEAGKILLASMDPQARNYGAGTHYLAACRQAVLATVPEDELSLYAGRAGKFLSVDEMMLGDPEFFNLSPRFNNTADYALGLNLTMMDV